MGHSIRLSRGAFFVWIIFAALFATAAISTPKKIDIRQSSFTVHVGRAGLLAGLGDEHWVRATVADGDIDEGPNPHIDLKIKAGELAVLPDKKISAQKQAQIQQTMETKVLEAAKYPDISFRSTSITPAGAGAWNVQGVLTLHGVAKTIQVPVLKKGDAFTGTARIKQTDFGIKTIKIKGGLIQVKDQLEVAFSVVPE